MNWDYTAQYVGTSLGVALSVRLLMLRLHRVYGLFSLFLLADLLGSIIWIFQKMGLDWLTNVDYRVFWVGNHCLICLMVVLTIYALLDAVLGNLPGILQFSRKLLNRSFIVASLIGATSAMYEYSAFLQIGNRTILEHLVYMQTTLDRVVLSTVLLVLLSILFFLLWFPVQVRRNLAVFIVGFLLYTASTMSMLLFQSFFIHRISSSIGTANEFLTSACFAYWGLFISPLGEKAPARLTIHRDRAEQDHLVRTLEQMNQSLLRAASLK